jgi:hypothetical protein
MECLEGSGARHCLGRTVSKGKCVTGCYFSTRYGSVDRVSHEYSLSYENYLIAVCYKCLWVLIERKNN